MFNVPAPKANPDIRLGADGKYAIDGGINLWRQETALPMSQAANILNLNADDRGTLLKRKGQAYLDTTLGSGGCNAVVFNNKIIKKWSTFLYKENLDGSSPVQIYSGLASGPAFMFPFQGLLYIFDGTNYIQWDGSTAAVVVPYIPIVSQGRKPDGTTSTLYEPLNLLTGSFTDMFSPNDGTTLNFVLSFTNLDAAAVTAIVNGVAKAETTDFTVNRTTGVLTWNSGKAPAIGTNTVKITAAKTNASDQLQIKNCTYAAEFDSRLFITGNPNFPNKLWKTGLTSNQAGIQANYFPASGYSSFDSVGSVDTKVTAFIKKFEKFIYFKEKSTHLTYAQTESDGSDGFPITSLNANIGCDMPGSVQLIDNMPIFFNSINGGYAILSTTVLGENIVKNFSHCINGTITRPGLLQESLSDLQGCASFNDGKKYYLCMPTSGKVYVWDYSMGYTVNNPESFHWFIYDNIHARNFFMVGNVLYYSSSVTGAIVKFIDAQNDFGNPISGVWKSKLMDFGLPEYYKNITDLWLTTRANSGSVITINHYDDNDTIINSTIIPSSLTKSFDWDSWDWDNFTWDYQRFAPTLRFKPGIKNIRYYQIEITNNEYNVDLSIVSLVLKWVPTRKVR